MYPFGVNNNNPVTKGLTDGGDAARSMALLQQQQQRLGLPLERNVTNHLSLQQRRGSGEIEVGRGMIHQSRTGASLLASHGLSASELMSASSLHDRERIITEELLKHRRRQQLGQHQEQVAAMALASRSQAFSKHQQQQQQHQREDLILKCAISQLSAISRQSHLPMNQNHRSHPQNSHQMLDNINRRCSNSSYCAEQDLSLEKDICFGRGQRVQRRKANVAFRKIVATYQETYDQAVSREDKKSVVKKVARIFSRTGYRFFKESEDAALYGNGSKMWIAVSDHHVEYKIGHSFRSGRKQLKQQKNERKEKEGSDVSVSSSGEVLTNKYQSCTTVAKEPTNPCVFKEDELSDKCICIEDKREKYTEMEAYQYFREFILTFKSIFGMTESFDEKTKIVAGLIEQIKSKKGYRFLKLMPLKKDVEFWVEASADQISCEVFSILGNPLEPNENKSIAATNSSIDNHDGEDESTSTKDSSGIIARKNQKRSSDATGNNNDGAPPKKRQYLLTGRTPEENCARPTTIKRIVSVFEPNLKDNKTGMKSSKAAKKSALENTKGDLVSPSSMSSTAKVEEKGDSKLVWKKGRKRALPEGLKKNGFVPSEIILCKDKIDGLSASKSSDSISKVERDVMSTISAQGLRIPSSLTSPGTFLQKISLETLRETQSLADMAPREKILQRNRLSSLDWSSRSTLEKALLAMRPSMHRTKEQPMTENTNLEATKQIEMKGKLLQHLRQQELLYIEKKHKLAMLDLQLRSRNGGI